MLKCDSIDQNGVQSEPNLVTIFPPESKKAPRVIEAIHQDSLAIQNRSSASETLVLESAPVAAT